MKPSKLLSKKFLFYPLKPRFQVNKPPFLHPKTSSTFAFPPSPTHARSHPLLQSRASVAEANPETTLTTSVFDELSRETRRKYVMISGKGGVGKTSLAASLAVRFAEAGHCTLVVSTDPAHSLGDSLAQDIGGGLPVPIEGTELPIWGMEIDPDQAREELRNAAKREDASKSAQDFMKGMGLGLIADQLAELKLGELLETPPPGLDESVAIAKVVEFVKSESYAKFTRIVFDTAPTGHALRMLALPDFVDQSLMKIIKLRRRIDSASAPLRALFGGGQLPSGEDGEPHKEDSLAKLERFRNSAIMVRDLFRDKESLDFVIVTIPTVLGVNESSRLARSLKKEGVPCNQIVVNQIITEKQATTFLNMKLKDQKAALELTSSDPALSSLTQIRAPYVDLEVRGLPGLKYFGGLVWQGDFDSLCPHNKEAERKYYMLGGKGGVGKTSMAASLAVRFASEGHPTLIVSTDPAHSLSDSLDFDVSGGKPVQVSDGGMGFGSMERLWGMEIDPEEARQELRELAQGPGGKSWGQEMKDMLSSVGLESLGEQIKELNLGELLDNPPPGIDEAVAIARVAQFVRADRYKHFTRIVFDTAPTGHTLRLLSLPDFLDLTIGKIARIRQKLSVVSDSVRSLFGKQGEKDKTQERLDQLRQRMEETRDLFRDKERTRFIIVTIPTVMAASESARLAQALQKEEVPLETLVINQVLPDESSLQQFLNAKRKDQQRALQLLRTDPNLRDLNVIEAPLIDLEVRGFPALQYFGKIVWK